MDISLFEKIRILGEGTFGKCFLAKYKPSDQYCVIKQINIYGFDDNQRKIALKEAKILEVLDHPNIIKFLGSFSTKDGYLNIIMQYAQGGDLSKKIKKNKGKHFSENQILNWFVQITLALKHVHDKQIIHRDIKSQNIFLTKNNQIKLGDFGIAKNLNQTFQNLGKMVLGTPYYMSPEICENKGYSFKTDIWSLGIILYELCALQPPFEANSLGALALKILKGDYNEIPDFYSKQLKKLIKQLLSVNPNKRISIQQILKNPLIKCRIPNFSDKNKQIQQFSLKIKKPNKNLQLKIDRIESMMSPKSPNYYSQKTPQYIQFKKINQFQQFSKLPKKNNNIQLNPGEKPIILTRKREVSFPDFNKNTNKLETQRVRKTKERTSVKTKINKSEVYLKKNIQNCQDQIKKVKQKHHKKNIALVQMVNTPKFKMQKQSSFDYQRHQEFDKCLIKYPTEQYQQEQIIYQQKQLELKKSIQEIFTQNQIQKKTETQETQTETLRNVLQKQINTQKLDKLLKIIMEKGLSFQQILDPQQHIIPLVGIYCAILNDYKFSDKYFI